MVHRKIMCVCVYTHTYSEGVGYKSLIIWLIYRNIAFKMEDLEIFSNWNLL